MNKVERFKRVEEIFRAAVRLDERERAAFLGERCANDPTLIAEVERLLRQDADDAGELDRPVFRGKFNLRDLTEAKDYQPALPESVGGYRVMARLGVGGMGAVYEAEQRDPRRRVALKVIRAGVVSPVARQRFRHEAQVLGQLTHPGIARIYEAGTADEGDGPQPYFAMELVHGQPITEYARAHQLSLRQCLELIVRVADALQHAHVKGIIHRDLKPANILVDETGQPKILDFGIARATDADVNTVSLRTDVGQLIGTIAYMSPEQAAGDPARLDTRSDVYSLGVVAYELLTGRLPYDVRDKMIHEAVRIIREVDATTASAIRRNLRGDAETIIGKALEKDPARRYQSATALAEDIRRFLSDQPIVARRPSTWYQFRKFARRNKALASGAAAVFIVLVAGLIGTTTYAAREAEQRRIAHANELRAIEQAERAFAAEAEAEQRAEELELVVEFQRSQLADIDTALMGDRLRADIIDKRRAALGASGLDVQAIEAALAELESSLASVNFTNIALATLDENIFERALKAIDEQFQDQPIVRARLLQTVASTLKTLGLLDRASDPQTEALDIRRCVLGDEHPDTLTSINNMGLTLQLQGHLTKAEPYFREALEGFRHVLGNEHSATLHLSHNMGALLRRQGEYAEAEPYFRAALEGRRRVLGDEHPDTLTSINSMGVLLRQRGKYAEAKPYVRAAMETSRRVLGDEHRDTLSSIGSMGALLFQQGKYDEAEPYLREAMEANRRVRGDEHPRTLTSINNMGELLRRHGKPAEAEPYLREAMETNRRVRGDEHEATLISIHNMGVLLRELDQFDEAERLGADAVETAKRALPEGHWRTAHFLSHHARTLTAMERFAEAELAVLEAHERLESAVGPQHDRTIGIMRQFIDLYERWHEHEPDAGHDAKAAEWRAKLRTSDESNSDI